MSEQMAGTEGLKRCTLVARRALKRVAPGLRAIEDAASVAPTSGLKPRSIGDRLRGFGRKGRKAGRTKLVMKAASAGFTFLVAVVTLGMAKRARKGVAARHDSEPHGLAKGVPLAHELIERALNNNKSDQRTAWHHHARRRRSGSRHFAHRR